MLALQIRHLSRPVPFYQLRLISSQLFHIEIVKRHRREQLVDGLGFLLGIEQGFECGWTIQEAHEGLGQVGLQEVDGGFVAGGVAEPGEDFGPFRGWICFCHLERFSRIALG